MLVVVVSCFLFIPRKAVRLDIIFFSGSLLCFVYWFFLCGLSFFGGPHVFLFPFLFYFWFDRVARFFVSDLLKSI